MTVREASPADAPAIERIARASWPATYGGLLAEQTIGRFLDDRYGVAVLELEIELCAGGERGIFLVTERGGEPIGYLHFVASGELGPELKRLYVHPDALGSGAGSALLAELHRRLEAGISYVVVVHPANERALLFYRRRGMVDAGETKALLRDERTESGCDVLLRATVPAR